MSNKSGVSGQVITLPEGGGALSGIGETFSPDLHTGTGNFSVPIALPPGRNGFQPALNLVYSTGNGNGPFGLGWGLSVPGVSRKTDKGVPRYHDGDPEEKPDTFILSGAEDLVPVEEPAPGVSRYRPRTEGLFALIDHHHDAGTNHWEVRSKDGLVSVYGTPAAAGVDPAALADPQNRRKVCSWMLTRTEDPFGNHILYEYEPDAGQDGPHEWDRPCLSRIRYVDFERNGATDYLVSVTFIYEDRPDNFSSYRCGFEVRTTKRCTAIEIRTHADRERLVRSYDLLYLDEIVAAGGQPASALPLNGLSLLSQIRVTGHDGDDTEPLPPLTFDYTAFDPLERQDLFPVRGRQQPARSLANADLELADLFGNGLPDIIQMNGAVRYWRNLGGGEYDMPRPMQEAPAGFRLADPQVQLMDVDGDGRIDLLVNQNGLAGYFPLSFTGEWDRRSFQRQAIAPSFSFADPEVRLVDLNGDGVTDAIRAGNRLECFFNDAKEGWKETRFVERSDLAEFPNVTFSDPRVKFGDMSGDSLQDIVLVHDGNVEYWPTLGHGRWGRRVAMRSSPRFPYGYDPRRILIGDVDGDGLDDIIYVDHCQVHLWINQSGNGWGEEIIIEGTPPLADVDAMRLVDILGSGTPGVLWSRDASQPGRDHLFFLDLTGGVKPYVMQQMNNHMGAVTRVEYAPSTRFYLADAQNPRTRWQTPLPFPVQVVARVEVIDEISRGKLTTEYRYHHGYWDGAEREFRGFGFVEQIDTETFDRYHTAGLHDDVNAFDDVSRQHFSPPMLSKTWFHQGPIGDEFGAWAEVDYSHEYWDGDLPVLGDLRPELTAILGAADSQLQRRIKRDALRTLRGSILRTELYALDESDRESRPYTVTESQYDVRVEGLPANRDDQRLPIFFPHPVAQRTTQWERGDEPMTGFSFSDDYDDFGQPRRQIALAVPRRRDFRVAAPTLEPYLGTVGATTFAQPGNGGPYIFDRVASSAAFEILNDGSPALFDLLQAVRDGNAQLEMFGQSFNYYDGAAFVGLPAGELGGFGALVRSETLVMTEAILRVAYRNVADATAPDFPPYLAPGGPTNWTAEYPQEYRDLTPPVAGFDFADGSDHRPRGFYVQAMRTQLDFQDSNATTNRGLPLVMRDPLGSDTTIDRYDGFDLMPERVADAAGLTTEAEYDYRVMQPRRVTDANNNETEFAFTPLELLREIFVRGKKATEGDNNRPSTRFEYDFLAFVNNGQPISVRTIQQEHHDTDIDVDPPDRDATIETVEYSDGFGRLVQTRTQAEALIFGDQFFGNGTLPADQDDQTGTTQAIIGRLNTDAANPNVVVSGWQVYDNKGQIVEKCEPFFDTGWNFDPPAGEKLGQKATMFYDPRGQVIRTLNPDGSEQRVIYGVPGSILNPDVSDPDMFEPTPWEAYTYDANDLAPISEAQLPDGTTGPLAERAPRHHHFTPTHIVIDALGRTVLAVARNRDVPASANAPLPPIEEFHTRSTHDIRGNLLTVTDALDREAFTYTYDLADNPLRIENFDAGVRRIILDVLGNEIERRDSKGALILQGYDILHRPIRMWARDDDAGPLMLRERLVYGDGSDPGQPAAERAANRAANRLGQLHRHYDEAGLLTFVAYDFKGNLLEKVRRAIADEAVLAVFNPPRSGLLGRLLDLLGVANPPPDWQVTPFRVTWQPPAGDTLAALEEMLLDPFEYRTSMAYDALNRTKAMVYPEDQDGERKALHPSYNRAGALEAVSLDDNIYVEHIAYNAKGQRSLIALGNGVMTRYAYDPRTFRLARLRSERFSQPDARTLQPAGSLLQDFAYDYDLVGNILHIIDRAPGSGVLNNPDAVRPDNPPGLSTLLTSGDALVRRFDYDAIYRLTHAEGGREANDISRPQPWNENPPWQGFDSANHGTPNQGNAPNLTRLYDEFYTYDRVGNMLRLRHRARVNGNAGGFTRDFSIKPGTNQLDRLTVGNGANQPPFIYTYDANGNMIAETTSRHFEWDHGDRMKVFRNQTAGSEPTIHAHYLYDAGGMRVKKLVRRQGSGFEVTTYIDGVFEHHRWRDNGGQAGENNHLHMMDDQQRVALVRIGPAHPGDRGPAVQYHLGDHLGSSNVVVDQRGNFTNREEQTPYGETSFGSFGRKRYRFSGKERDEESGLNFHSARYFALWLARWISCDPAGASDGFNLYRYVWSNPLQYVDSTGTQSDKPDSNDKDVKYDTTVGVFNYYEKDDIIFYREHGPKQSDLHPHLISPNEPEYLVHEPYQLGEEKWVTPDEARKIRQKVEKQITHEAYLQMQLEKIQLWEALRTDPNRLLSRDDWALLGNSWHPHFEETGLPVPAGACTHVNLSSACRGFTERYVEEQVNKGAARWEDVTYVEPPTPLIVGGTSTGEQIRPTAKSFERARNQALKEFGEIDPATRRSIVGRLGAGKDKIVGFETRINGVWKRFRIDYDPTKGPHINIEIGKGPQGRIAFPWQGTEKDFISILRHFQK